MLPRFGNVRAGLPINLPINRGSPVPGSIRQRSKTSWELIAYIGFDAQAGKRRYARKTFRGPHREAERELARFVTEVTRGGRESADCSRLLGRGAHAVACLAKGAPFGRDARPLPRRNHPCPRRAFGASGKFTLRVTGDAGSRWTTAAGRGLHSLQVAADLDAEITTPVVLIAVTDEIAVATITTAPTSRRTHVTTDAGADWSALTRSP